MNNMLEKGDYIILNKDNINSLINNNCYIIDHDLLSEHLEIIIPDNLNLKFYLIDYKKSFLDINFIQNNNSNIEFNFSITSNSKSSYKVYNSVNGNNNKTLIKGRIFNNIDADTTATIDGVIKEGTTDNDYTEDIRGLNLYSNNLEIKPNLIVSTNEVIANHMVTIGDFDENMVGYLKEKGISDENIKVLLLDAFLKEIFPKDIFDK